MRYLVIVMVSCALVAFSTGPAAAVGYFVAGKECDCCPLTARGIVPDTLNKFKLAFSFPWVTSTLDSVAVEIRTLLGQMGVGAVPVAAVAPPEEPKEKPKDKATDVKEKPKTGKEAKPDLKQKKPRKISKKKKVKVPPRAL
jgi:hypothetical protein